MRGKSSADPSGREHDRRVVVGVLGLWALYILSLLLLHVQVPSRVLVLHVKVWCAMVAQCRLWPSTRPVQRGCIVHDVAFVLAPTILGRESWCESMGRAVVLC